MFCVCIGNKCDDDDDASVDVCLLFVAMLWLNGAS